MRLLGRQQARLSSLVRNLFRKERVEQDLDDEMRSHLDLLTDRKLAQGLAPDEARCAPRSAPRRGGSPVNF